jgi:valyl-tRNA synthetase
MTRSLEKVYDPSKVESKWYKHWLEKGYMHAEVKPGEEKYCIVIPPPNITGILTVGHVLVNSLQDVLIRWQRMQGNQTLWMPGTDHAGIATQNVVEQELTRQGSDRYRLGRERFVDLVWKWKDKYGGVITQQLRRLGCSCDWDRERFTLDEGLSRAVVEVFVRLYEKGLIYKGSYIVNWCPRCNTAISDEEVDHKDIHGSLYYISYPLTDGGKVTVATTRPETMLGDTAVAINPDDERHRDMIGKTATIPYVNREIPFITDDFVSAEFGTGVVKVTPAHDPNDFLMGKRHGLEEVNVMNPDGTMNENAGPYRGMDRYECRKKLLEDLERDGLLERIETHEFALGECHRCGTSIEPYLSEQWFVSMKELAKPAIDAVVDGKIRFHPDRWVGVYLHWMENIRDWCISRQLWWGHRIPAYYCTGCEKMIVARERPQECECGSGSFRQDEDVLDTWFSSWLWPISTLGWPEETEELKYFFPTDVLVTGPDIIFFWVARMIMASLEFNGDIPFRDVFFNGIVRDDKGRKMSKSLGNSPDPTELMDEFGADPLRYSMVANSPYGQDVVFSTETIESARNFCNKIWNATRFLLMQDESEAQLGEISALEDRWILSRAHKCIEDVQKNLESFRFNDAASSIYSFFWHEYCDWYLEAIKPRLYGDDNMDRKACLHTGRKIMDVSMRLLHPFIPYITEEVWSYLPDRETDLMVAPWPNPDDYALDEDAESDMKAVMDVSTAARNIRGELGVPPGRRGEIFVRAYDQGIHDVVIKEKDLILELTKTKRLTAGTDLQPPKPSGSFVMSNCEVFMPLSDLIDVDAERMRIAKRIEAKEGELEQLDTKLSNQSFLQNAPDDVVKRAVDKRDDAKDAIEKLKANLNMLEA